ncbi:MAG: TrmH family RNA methyltransferase [Pseudoxanthomonas suwonensis]|nr:TrmH family RNA methyltransferase [Pseudoxanthomonas suwonensis]
MSGPWKRASPARGAGGGQQRRDELRVHGVNAVREVFARRPQALRKLYLTQSRLSGFADVMRWCAANRIGYRIVEDDDLRRLAASSHHEGVVADVLREPVEPLSEWLAALPDGPCCLLWLDGVGNPHNLGAILRSAAHFGVAALLVPDSGELQLSGAAARVAEGGAEHVRLVALSDNGRSDLAALRAAGFTTAATLVSGGDELFAASLPARLVYVMGEEQSGMDRGLAAACDLRLSIPGSGAVESLNVAAATAVFLAAWAAAVQAA